MRAAAVAPMTNAIARGWCEQDLAQRAAALGAVADALDLSRTIAGKDPGSTVDITLLRGGSEQTVSVTLDTLEEAEAAEEQAPVPAEPDEPAAPAPSSVGITLVPNAEGDGLLIQDVDPASIPASKGFAVGDSILEVDNTPVSTAAEFEAAISGVRDDGRGTALVKAERNGNVRFIGLPLDEDD